MNEVPDRVLDELRSIVGPESVRTADRVRDLDPGQHPDNLAAGVVVLPSTTDQVAAVVRCCAANGVAIVSHGGRTGLVGGGISHPGEVVLSSQRLHSVSIDPAARVAVVGAGCTLQALQEQAAIHGLEPGIDLAARGSATIGGMVSTNAGGVMAFRNGVMRHRVLGLEAVLPDGSVYSDLTKVVKHSAGYDLKHLLIGAEGTLGVVTRVVLKLDPLPTATATAMLALPSFAAVLDAIRIALDSEVGHLRAAEALWRDYLMFTATELGWHASDVDLDQPVFLLLLLGGAHEQSLHDALVSMFHAVSERHPGATGIIAGSARQAAELWRLREDTEIVYRYHPAAPSYDVSLPVSEIESYVERIVAELVAIEPSWTPFVFGHVADGNLHVMLNHTGDLPPALSGAVEDVLYRHLPAMGGSFSAEHGVGSKRITPMLATSDATKLALMRTIKAVIDPQRLMNPGKVLPAD